MSKDETFKRGQVQLALWGMFARTGAMPQRPGDVPRTFATRVRKFGEFGIPVPERSRSPGSPAWTSSTPLTTRSSSASHWICKTTA